MDINTSIIEVHLSSGLTLPLRKAKTKQGKDVWAVLDRDPRTGERRFNGFGVNLPVKDVKHPTEITTIKAEGFGTIRMHHDISPAKINPKNGKLTGNQPRATGSKEITGSDGELYTLTFRATLRSGDDSLVNIAAEVKKSGIGFKTRVMNVQDL